MNIKYLLLLLVIVLGFTSCISTKQLVYLQEDENAVDSLYVMRKKPDPYRVQVNDLLSIRGKAIDPAGVATFNPTGDTNPNAQGEERLYYDGFAVDPHGNIRIPELGDIAVLGLTVDEIRQKIENMLLESTFKAESELFITVKLAGIRYTVNGEIGSPGSNIIYRDAVNIMEAIANNGDITITGDRSNVVVIRQLPAGQRVGHINLNRMDAINSPYYWVQPNDLILINPLPQKALGTGRTGLESFTTILTIFSAVATTILLFTRL